MPLLRETLHPLQATTIQGTYCLDRNLQYIATRYTLPETPVTEHEWPPVTLLLIGGISLQQETWLPIVKRLLWLASRPGSPIHIQSIWTMERPNHGDSALLNEKLLKEHYSVIFPSSQYSAAIKTFLASDALSPAERENLVGVGHSGGGGSLIQALPEDGSNIPLRTLILVESPHCDESSWPYFQQLYKVVKRSNARRPTVWNTVDDAVKWMKTHIPWKSFHPDVFEIIPQTYFREIEGQPGKVTTKTTVEQETACFVDDGTHLSALTQLRTVLDRLPTHLIIGSEKDIWPDGLNKIIARNIEKDRPRLGSVTTIEGSGHYLHVEQPREVADQIFRILHGRPALQSAKI